MKKKSFRQYMRIWHRQIGFLLVGLLVVYSVSGVILTYRNTNFLKKKTINTKELQPGLSLTELEDNLKVRHFEVEKESEGIIYFAGGTYDKNSGVAQIINYEVLPWLKPLLDLHKTSSQGGAHYITTALGILLLFMTVSSFWMFKPGGKLFKQGIYLSLAGVILVAVLIYFF